MLCLVFFIIWMFFFDQRDVLNTLVQKKKWREIIAKKKYYETEISKTKKTLLDLQNNVGALEKFAREHYLMKKEGEDIYLIEDSL